MTDRDTDPRIGSLQYWHAAEAFCRDLSLLFGELGDLSACGLALTLQARAHNRLQALGAEGREPVHRFHGAWWYRCVHGGRVGPHDLYEEAYLAWHHHITQYFQHLCNLPPTQRTQ
jgi:hypothetical protein